MLELGICCHKFTLPCGPEEMYAKIKTKTVMDGFVLLEILRYVGLRPVSFMGYSPAHIKRVDRANRKEMVHVYTCIRYDQKTGKCKDWFLRPDMCKVYNHGFCEHTHRCQSTWCSEHIDNISNQEQLVKAGTLKLDEAVAEIKTKLGADVAGRIPLIGAN